jgi:hypothetical protein
MQYLKLIYEILDRAESEIRHAGAEAFRASDDVATGEAREIVSVLKSLRSKLNGSSQILTASPPAEAKQIDQSKSTRHSSRSSTKSKYPRYSVRNGTLIRVGWSKKKKAEYEHKAPREAFDRTIKALEYFANLGDGPYMAEKIIEYINNSIGPIPSYQAYIVIGLLRDYEYLQQVGREGYIIPTDIPLKASQLWGEVSRGNI